MLYEQGRAILPGFGEWILEKLPASIHPDEELIYPPRLHIHFHYEPNVDAQPLVQFIAEWQNIIPAVAELQMKKSLRPLEELLLQGKTVDIPLVGTLHRDENGMWIFTESPLLELGLEALPIRPLLRSGQPAARAGSPEQKPEPAAIASSAAAGGTIPSAEPSAQEIAEAEPYPFEDRPSRGKGWWIALGVVLILIAVGWTAWDKGWLKPLQKKIWGDTITTSAPAVPQQSISSDSAQHHRSGSTGADSVNTYQLVLSGYADSSQAARFLNEVVNKGWPNAMFVKDSASDLYLVIIPVSTTAADTQQWVSQFQQIFGGHPYFRKP